MRWILRVTGLFALLLFLTPTFFVLRYYLGDHARETRRAALVSTAWLSPAVPLAVIAPPLAPPASGNAAAFYVPAIQSYADRLALSSGARLVFPHPAEVSALLEGARHADCRFFARNAQGRPLFVFHDPEANGQPVPYRFPVSPQEQTQSLGAACALAAAVAGASASGPAGDRHQIVLGRALVRFGASLGRERATRAHLEASYVVQKIGLGLLEPFGGTPLERYVDSLQIYEEAVQAKYALLEPRGPDNIALQEKVAERDADPMWRREAVWALGATISAPGMTWSRPLEALTGKAALAQVATQDADPSVRAAASETLGEIAQRGVVIRR